MFRSVLWNVFPCVLVCTTAGALKMFHGCLNGNYAKKNMYTIPKEGGLTTVFYHRKNSFNVFICLIIFVCGAKLHFWYKYSGCE